MNQTEFVIPDVLKTDQPPKSKLEELLELILSPDDYARVQNDQEDKLEKLLSGFEFRSKYTDELAVRSALGDIRLPHIIPAHLTEEVVGRVGPLSISRSLASIYTLRCSSLYYETLSGQIRLRQARKYSERLSGLFKDHLGALSTDGLFTKNFGGALKEYQAKSDRPSEIPADLLDILDFPLGMREGFNRFFNKMHPSKTNPSGS